MAPSSCLFSISRMYFSPLSGKNGRKKCRDPLSTMFLLVEVSLCRASEHFAPNLDKRRGLLQPTMEVPNRGSAVPLFHIDFYG